MNPPKFSLQTLVMLTVAFAVGFAVLRAQNGEAFDFLLGFLTALIGGGLLQQVIRPSSRDGKSVPAMASRRIGLLLIIAAMCIAIHHGVSPYEISLIDWEGNWVVETRESNLAVPLWVFTLLLGSLTANGLMRVNDPTTARQRAIRLVITGLTAIVFCIYAMILVREWTFIAALVECAVFGVQVGLLQPASVNTEHYVFWFGREPQLFDRFINYQLVSWPMLLLSLVLAVGAAQGTFRRFWTVVLQGLSVLLTVPAILNIWWLADGNLHSLFPQLTTTYWEQDRPDFAWMLFVTLATLTFYLSTRRVRVREVKQHEPSSDCWIDHSLVGWTFIMMGLLGIRDSLRIDTLDAAYDLLSIASHWREIPEIAGERFEELFLYVEYQLPAFLFFFGVWWLWQRRRNVHKPSARWPQVRRLQWLSMPWIFLLLATNIIMCIPFGIAMFNWV
ncbi:MAG: hypothetical protein AAF989_11275 [Planctomycetota bacterium]